MLLCCDAKPFSIYLQPCTKRGRGCYIMLEIKQGYDYFATRRNDKRARKIVELFFEWEPNQYLLINKKIQAYLNVLDAVVVQHRERYNCE